MKDIFKDKLFACPLCAKKQEIRMSKKDKPYIVCDNCGVQLFIRKSEGVRILAEKVGSEWWE